MEKPVVAGTAPIAVDVKKGEAYYWCACGRSKNQPFCDGAHQGTSFNNISLYAEMDETIYFCTCKQTKNPPYCDGSHRELGE